MLMADKILKMICSWILPRSRVGLGFKSNYENSSTCNLPYFFNCVPESLVYNGRSLMFVCMVYYSLQWLFLFIITDVFKVL